MRTHRNKIKPIYLFLGITTSLITIFLLVWYFGGTSSAITHLFYIPIIFTALACSWKHSLAVALISGILLSGGIMPLRTDPLIYQELSVWLIRLFMFVIASLWTSIMFEYLNNRSQLYRNQINELYQIHQATVHALVDLTELRDSEVTGRHLNRLSYYAELLADELGIDPELKENIIKTIALHDIGKVAVPDHILNKPGALNQYEWEVMKKHPTQGAGILNAITHQVEITNPAVINYMKVAQEIAYSHHEKYDGSGYPQGLKGKEIPLSARIAALCDVYDSLRSQRPYKKPYSHQVTTKIILAERGAHFDPEIVDAFITVAHQFADIWEESDTDITYSA